MDTRGEYVLGTRLYTRIYNNMRTRENFFLACNRTRIILLRVKKPQILEYVLEYFQNFKLKSINVYCKKT